MVLFTAVLVAFAFQYPREVHSAVGDPVPNFDLIDLAGKRHTYTEYEGRILLLFFLGHN
jgi:hypothetical protein